ncbi:hypothetical protein ZTR_02846 [Talaromyces verruculosus]|nr:hypothetical protein ZTR_02846 [Talaromyces verruculosus]
MAEVVSGLLVGQRFSSLEEFKSAIRNISVRQHWDLRVVRSNKKSVVLGCRSSANCYFRVVCRANKNATYITSLQDTHSCRRNLASPGSTPARSEASHVRFLLNEIPKLFDMKSKIKGQDVVDAVKRYHGYDISMRQAQRALTKLQPRQSRGGHSQVADHEDHDITHDHSSSVRVNNETSFDPLADDRGWPENGLSTTLMEDDSMDQDDSPTETTAAAMIRVQQNNPSLATMSHHAQPGPSDTRSLSVSTMSHHASQIPPLQPSGQGPYVQPIQLPIPHSPPKTQNSPSLRHPHPQSHPQTRPQPPPPQHQQQAHTGHPVTTQLVLTNFKIEFTCTSCGALNQSFFPNQGNVTGNNYLPPAGAHGIPPSAPSGAAPPSVAPNGRLTMDGVAADTTTNAVAAAGFGETDYQASTASHSRELPPWGSGLDVSIPPPNT